MRFFLDQKKRVKPCVKRGSQIIYFWGILLQKGLLIDHIQRTVFG